MRSPARRQIMRESFLEFDSQFFSYYSIKQTLEEGGAMPENENAAIAGKSLRSIPKEILLRPEGSQPTGGRFVRKSPEEMREGVVDEVQFGEGREEGS